MFSVFGIGMLVKDNYVEIYAIYMWFDMLYLFQLVSLVYS